MMSKISAKKILLLVIVIIIIAVFYFLVPIARKYLVEKQNERNQQLLQQKIDEKIDALRRLDIESERSNLSEEDSLKILQGDRMGGLTPILPKE